MQANLWPLNVSASNLHEKQASNEVRESGKRHIPRTNGDDNVEQMKMMKVMYFEKVRYIVREDCVNLR